MKKIILILLIFALLILSCWNSSPTSDKSKSFKVSGKVTDKNDAGIESVAVSIFGTNFSADDTTNAQGVFSFRDISSGSYTIKTSAESRVFKPSGIDVIVSDSDIDNLEFTEAENRVHGQVFDIITNKGISDLKMIIAGNADNVKDSTYTDINGGYEFFDLNPEVTYSVSADYYFLDRMRNGSSYPWSIKLLPKEFTTPDTNVHTLYMSSEVLQITTATYSQETNTVHLEWTPSKSNYCIHYNVIRIDKLPLESIPNTVISESYPTNYAFIEITPKYLALIKYAKAVHYAVSANYRVDSNIYWEFNGPNSEPVTFQLTE